MNILPSVGRIASTLALAAGTLLSLPLGAQTRGSYGYLRTLDGSATLVQNETSERVSAEINQPILSGDRLLVAGGSRAEVVLADSTVVTIDGQSEVEFEHLALSSDEDDDVRASRLRLVEGEIRIDAEDIDRDADLPEVETANAIFYLQEIGFYRITGEGDDWSEIVVRRGAAETATDRGSSVVQAGETAQVVGAERPRVVLRAATGADALERWADNLRGEADPDVDRYVDEDLGYRAAPLARYGSWTTIDRQQVWRPRVAAGWRPYSVGCWVHTPAGLTWVASEPWGWVPYHYGTWDYFPTAGWCWVPGRVFSPAWVYWYWGPRYVGWCPVGYYTRHYGNGGFGFRAGVYGWAGGDWRGFSDWSFISVDRFGGRRLGGYIRPGRDLGVALERGILTTDTRILPRDRWHDSRVAIETFRRGRQLPDVSDFIDRRRELPGSIRRLVALERPTDVLAGTPLRPETLGRGAGGQAPGAPSARPGRGDRSGRGSGRSEPIDRRGPGVQPRPGEVIGQPAPGSPDGRDRRPGRPTGEVIPFERRPGSPTTGEPTRRPDDRVESGPGERSDPRSGDRDPGVERRKPSYPVSREPAPGYRRPIDDRSDDGPGGGVEERRPPAGKPDDRGDRYDRGDRNDEPAVERRPIERQPIEQPIERKPIERQPIERRPPAQGPGEGGGEPPPGSVNRRSADEEKPVVREREQPSAPREEPRERRNRDQDSKERARPRGHEKPDEPGGPPPRG